MENSVSNDAAGRRIYPLFVTAVPPPSFCSSLSPPPPFSFPLPCSVALLANSPTPPPLLFLLRLPGPKTRRRISIGVGASSGRALMNCLLSSREPPELRMKKTTLPPLFAFTLRSGGVGSAFEVESSESPTYWDH